MGGGGQANFTGKCTNFLTGASFPCEEWGSGALCRCSIRSRRTARRPFSSVSPPEGKRPFTAPAPRAAGPRPGESQRPPRARSRARAGGADDRHQPGPGETAGAAPRPRAAPATFAGGEFRRVRAGAGGAAAALWAAIQCRAFLKRGVWRVSPWGDPPRTTRFPTGKSGTRGESHENEQHRPAASERAAQGARAPPPRRCPAYAGRGCSEGSCCSIRCAAAWRPVVHALPRILPPGINPG